jgi:uncharacterized protein
VAFRDNVSQNVAISMACLAYRPPFCREDGLGTEERNGSTSYHGQCPRHGLCRRALKDVHAKGDAKSDGKGGAKPQAKPEAAKKPETDTELPQEDAEPPTVKKAHSPNGLYEFGEERWGELYSKKIEEMIAVVKSKGAPVIWVGLPAIRAPKGTSDMLFLDPSIGGPQAKPASPMSTSGMALSMKAGASCRMPDFENQIRQLRSNDGVFFTKAGARKLAHYVEREITRLLAARSGQIACPPSRRRLTQRRRQASPRLVRWRGRFCR